MSTLSAEAWEANPIPFNGATSKTTGAQFLRSRHFSVIGEEDKGQETNKEEKQGIATIRRKGRPEGFLSWCNLAREARDYNKPPPRLPDWAKKKKKHGIPSTEWIF
jgi:hypothetical protein